MSETVCIEWVNHASFVLACGDVRLMSDPWLFGSAFNNGWDLLCKSKFEMDDFASISHIWFSHEHPDHFSPPVLKQIPADVRQGITVIFQETQDRKVINYCAGLGFRVQELRNHRWHELAPGCRVMCGKVPFFDSWLLIEAGGRKVLNINDCVVDGEGVAADIVQHTGPVELLLTQFSYANWLGNPEDVELRRASAQEKLARVKTQIETFRPRYTIPFASFVYFSHEENVYLNDAINTVRDAHDFIIRETASMPVVLYPGEAWVMGEPHDNAPSLVAYDADYDVAAKPVRRSQSVSLDELILLARDYIARMRTQNSNLLIRLMALPPLRYFETVTFHLTDLNQVVAFDLHDGLRPVELVPGAADVTLSDVTLSSESLAYVFKFDWGIDTLEVNGRFRATQQGHKRLIKTFFLGALNNTGRYLHPRTALEPSFMRRALSKLRALSLGG